MFRMETRQISDEIRDIGKQWGGLLGDSLRAHHEVNVSYPLRAIPSSHLITYVTQLVDPTQLGKALKVGEELALTLGAKSCRISRHYGDIMFEVPLPRSYWQTLYVKDIDRRDNLWLSLGETSRLDPVHCRLDAPCIAPILIAGKTGSGKTELMKLILWELCTQNTPDKLQLVLYDPKGKFAAWRESAHLALPILKTPEQAISGLNWLMQRLTARMDIQEPLPHIVFAVDELIELMLVDEKLVSTVLGRLASIGREKNIRMLIATQRPDRAHIDKVGAANIGLRLLGQVSDTTEATVAAGMGGTGAHLLDGRGDMLAIQGGDVYRMQTAMLRDRELGILPRGDIPELPVIDLDIIEYSDNLKFTPREMAVGLTGIGICKLKTELSMGQPRATQLR